MDCLYFIPTMIEAFFEDFLKEKKKMLDMFGALECLTQKRVEMIKTIMAQEPNSIRELSRILDRNVKNVFEDLALLQKNQIVRLEGIGRTRKPIVVIKRIVLTFNGGENDNGNR
jgi:predicted transcriptional regulator